MGTPLRGELTLPASNIPKTFNQTDINNSLDNIQGVLSHVVRLAAPQPQGPKILVSQPASPQLSGDADEAAAAWSWTAAEAVSTEVALLPLLMHLAAARDDVQGLHYCLASDMSVVSASPDLSRAEGPARSAAVVGGMANCIDPASGRSPLHVAALNGSVNAANALLEAGALVHLRDALGHTALYYVRAHVSSTNIGMLKWGVQAARQGHQHIVENLVNAGANLGGSDVEGGFVPLIVQKANHSQDERALRIWRKAGADI